MKIVKAICKNTETIGVPTFETETILQLATTNGAVGLYKESIDKIIPLTELSVRDEIEISTLIQLNDKLSTDSKHAREIAKNIKSIALHIEELSAFKYLGNEKITKESTKLIQTLEQAKGHSLEILNEIRREMDKCFVYANRQQEFVSFLLKRYQETKLQNTYSRLKLKDIAPQLTEEGFANLRDFEAQGFVSILPNGEICLIENGKELSQEDLPTQEEFANLLNHAYSIQEVIYQLQDFFHFH